MSDIFGNVKVPSITVDGVVIPSFEMPTALEWALSQGLGANWEANIAGKAITLVQADGSQAENEFVTYVVDEADLIIEKIEGGNQFLVSMTEMFVNGLISTGASALFAQVLKVVTPKTPAAA